METKWLKKPIKGLLLDISGVLKNGNEVVHGSLRALEKLRSSKLPFRLVTNETQATTANLVKDLAKLGFIVTEEEIFAPAPALVSILQKNKLRPYLLVHKQYSLIQVSSTEMVMNWINNAHARSQLRTCEDSIIKTTSQVLKEFKDINTDQPNCVVLGDAATNFSFENLNKAFRILIDLPEPIFYSLGLGKYYKEKDGLTLDVGPFAKALEFATGVKPRVIGKPEPSFFLAAVKDMNLSPSEYYFIVSRVNDLLKVVMIGDDIETDVGGAQECGLRGVLVRTGKFRPGDENHPRVKPDAIVLNLFQAVEMVLNNPLTVLES